MNFDEIIGNKEAKAYLDSSIKSQKILHSYIFSGIEGIGKSIIAREYARKILCTETGEKNCNCKSCTLFFENSSPDYIDIDEEGKSIKIEKIRNLTEKIIEKPIISKRKVITINDAENMTKESQNSLLKTLEEPPEYVTIILITSNDNNLLTTIKSRCTKINFIPLSKEEIQSYLKNNNIEENSSIAIDYCGGSIGKLQEIVKNGDLYNDVKKCINGIEKDSIIDFLNHCKVIYDKEKVFNILDYLIVYFYLMSKEKITYLYCIQYVNEAIKRLKANTNLEMTIDNMLLKIWEEFNEKGNRC